MTMQADISRAPMSLPRFIAKNRLLVALITVPVLAAVVVSRILGVPFEIDMLSWMLSLLGAVIPAFLIVLMLGRFVHLAVVVRPKRPTQTMIQDVKRVFLDADRMLTGTASLGLFIVFFSAFSYLKFAIPFINPFSWDVTFAEWDRALHFGIDPYRIVMGLIGTPTITTVVNLFYHGWLFLVYFAVLAACYSKADRAKAYTYLVAFVLTWFIGGNVVATLLSSAGPVYYEALGFGGTFAPLVDTLHKFHEISPVMALDVHQMLWDGYVADGRARGISAMPSMHVASSALLMFYAYSWRRWAGHLLAVFCAVIMIGSVMLAWHYAIDGYLGFLIAFLCWKLARWMVARDASSA
ncbi:PAP2 superfamily protein [Shimia gijangensis]|uniref:PAP2 superfamily protein n=1 Tax=Shimia gijangensis TaxID=1470563 RepID=A0A1M6G2B2_9RHOB|nr:phosphatase PAP2 family protein [Shimia gijangensis]SHJ04024.1 PAP2 superfamily protein [Shimia gijangensis]